MVCQLTTEMHCNGSRPNQDRIKMQHSIKEGKKESIFMENIYVMYIILLLYIKYGIHNVLSS